MRKNKELEVLTVGEYHGLKLPEQLNILGYHVNFIRSTEENNMKVVHSKHTISLVLIFSINSFASNRQLTMALSQMSDACIILYEQDVSDSYYLEISERYPFLTDILRYPENPDQFHAQIRTYIRFQESNRAYQLSLQKEQYKRQLSENEVVKTNILFENIIHKSHVGILLIDNGGIIRFANKASEDIFMRKSDDLIGQSFGMIGIDDKNNEIEIVRRSGEIGIGELSISETEWRNKEARLVMINDVTKYKKLLKKYEKAKKEAEEADKLKTAFLANMSHEIRTPMNGIVGFAQLLKDNEIDESERNKFLNIIISSGDHLLTLINDILDIAKIEAGQLKVEYKRCDLVELMNEVHNIFSINEKFVEKDIQLKLHIGNHEKLPIITDMYRLKQVFINLINNALKFTFKGSIEFGFYMLNEDKKILFFVKDSGIGIPKKEYKNIFKRFTKVESESGEQIIEGTGIGLSICQSLIELMGGEIWVSSTEGKGTTFNFTLPHLEPSNNTDNDNDRTYETTQKALINKRVLIVEDSNTNYMLLSSILKHFDIKIFWAKNGREAVKICEREQIDVVLMDIKLPILNGYEATRKIKENKPKLPVIAQTAYAMESDKEKCLAAGCDDYIEKPLNINTLLDKLTAFIS